MKPAIGLVPVLVAITARGLVAGAPFQSGPAQVSLIELYTSEGCSSCPPAERWLGQLRDDARLWREFVPVAFHVNYWDYIGWKDRFASKVFTERQYAVARAWRSSQVYTPCFVRDGREWRSRDLERGATPAAGRLTADMADDGRVQVTFQPTEDGGSYDVFVALLGGDIKSDVKAGENSGRKLAHEFVALALQSTALRAEAGGKLGAGIEIALAGVPATPRRALAVWVTRRGELASIQATGGWLE